MLAHEVPQEEVSNLEVLDSHAAKLAKEDLEELSSQGNRRRRNSDTVMDRPQMLTTRPLKKGL
jgi:hypothetical protein